jgi:hypothetical protein
MKINAGDRVTLKTSWHIMTVERVHENTDQCVCVWFHDGLLHRQEIGNAALVVIPDEEWKRLMVSANPKSA